MLFLIHYVYCIPIKCNVLPTDKMAETTMFRGTLSIEYKRLWILLYSYYHYYKLTSYTIFIIIFNIN